MPNLTPVLSSYQNLLAEVDDWFSGCLRTGGSQLSCRRGCSACCRGLFDITLLDAWLLRNAFSTLPKTVQQDVLRRCQPRLAELTQRWPNLHQPYLLNALPEDEWMEMPEEDQTPCPLLDAKGDCLVYASRPMTCRLHGLPNVDISGEDFDGTVCPLHTGDPKALPEQVLHWRFRECFTREIELFGLFTRELTGEVKQELDTFIPLALLADYAAVDWLKFKL